MALALPSLVWKSTPTSPVVPPVRAECMYDIGTSAIAGGGGTLRVTTAGGRVAAASE